MLQFNIDISLLTWKIADWYCRTDNIFPWHHAKSVLGFSRPSLCICMPLGIHRVQVCWIKNKGKQLLTKQRSVLSLGNNLISSFYFQWWQCSLIPGRSPTHYKANWVQLSQLIARMVLKYITGENHPLQQWESWLWREEISFTSGPSQPHNLKFWRVLGLYWAAVYHNIPPSLSVATLNVRTWSQLPR